MRHRLVLPGVAGMLAPPGRSPTDLLPGLDGGVAAAVFLTLRRGVRSKTRCDGDATRG
jgi:hypothetical protein